MTEFNEHALEAIRNPFHFANTDVRTALDEYGEAWFCAKDVFEALDIAWRGANSLKKMPEKWQGVRYLRTPSGTQETVFISEPGVYLTAFRSNKPEAIRFTQWVCEDVLPSLRRQGFYGTVTAGQNQSARCHVYSDCWVVCRRSR